MARIQRERRKTKEDWSVVKCFVILIWHLANEESELVSVLGR